MSHTELLYFNEAGTNINQRPINYRTPLLYGSRASSVGIATDYGLDDLEEEIFLYLRASRKVLGPTQLPIQWAPGTHSPGGEEAGA
jgi:hypothetical protein